MDFSVHTLGRYYVNYGSNKPKNLNNVRLDNKEKEK